MFVVIRLLRLTRTFRLFRLVHFVQPLWQLVHGMVKASSVIVWVMLLLFVLIYIFAVFATNVVGNACREGEDYADFPDCYVMFGNLPRSMYTLFQILTLESWSMAVARPVLEEKPWMFLFFAMFLYLTTFGLLNVFTGVIVEQTLTSAEEGKMKAWKDKLDQERRNIDCLQQVVDAADGEKNGFISKEAFIQACRIAEVQKMFDVLELPVHRDNLARRLFEVIDSNLHGVIAIGEFLDGICRLKEEGRSITKDSTLMLMEVRHLDRRLAQIQRGRSEELDAMEARITSHLVRLEERLDRSSKL